MALAAKVGQLLAEHNITYTRLVMPTRDNCTQLEALIEAGSQLLDTKKNVDRVEQDIRVLKARLANKEGLFPSDIESPMDVDPATPGDGDVADEREQSVISTKSARGRKNVSAICEQFYC
jgi:DNA methyltransferase 1-associated protein 1